MEAVANLKKLGLVYMAAASLKLHIEVIASQADPDALCATLQAVASFRAAIAGCTGLQARVPLASTFECIIDFAAEACAQGLPESCDDSDAVWRLVATAITCGLELVEICSTEDTISSKSWIKSLHILAATLDTLKAML